MTVHDPDLWTRWLCGQALPLWAGAGHDTGTGSFVERLALDGTPQHDVPRRVMVQARQIHAFATAARRGWFPAGAELALRAGDAMISRYAMAEGEKGWVFSCTRDGAVLDLRRDLYAQAFVLLALAALIRLDPQPRYVALVRRTLAFLDRDMVHPAGGYVECWPDPTLPRRQNPHMHLLESILALHETGVCGDFSPRVAGLIGLFDRRFLSAKDDVLTEFFAADWTPDNAARSFEPGHHFEWVWLLSRATALTGIATDDAAGRLLRRGMAGLDAQGRVVEQMGPNGPIAPSQRLWCSMEVAKALALPSGHAARPQGVGNVLTAAWHGFIAPAVPGGWIDRIDADGAALVDHMPASSLYHICTALDVVTPP